MLFSELAAGSGVMPIATLAISSEYIGAPMLPPPTITTTLPGNTDAGNLNLAGIAEVEIMWPDIPPPKK